MFAIWMDGSGAVTPQGLQIPPLRYAPVGMTKDRAVTSRNVRDLDGRIRRGYSARTADPSTALRSGRDDKGEGGYFSERSRFGWTDQVRSLRRDCRSLHCAALR